MLIYLTIQIFFAVLLTELLTELVVKSEIFRLVREQVSGVEWFKKLFSCGYCFSVWVAFVVVFCTKTSYPLVENIWVDLGLMSLIVHRFSNILHNVIDKWTDKYYSLAHVNTEKSNE